MRILYFLSLPKSKTHYRRTNKSTQTCIKCTVRSHFVPWRFLRTLRLQCQCLHTSWWNINIFTYGRKNHQYIPLRWKPKLTKTIYNMLTCTALFRKQLFCPGAFQRPFVVWNIPESLEFSLECWGLSSLPCK